jgi:hypothetical protein
MARLGVRRPRDSRSIARCFARRSTNFVQDLRAATNGGWALGDARFKQQIAQALGRRVVPLPKGRPPKAVAERRQLNLL